MNMTLEEQVKLYREISEKIEALEQQKKEISLAIMEKMQGASLQLPGFVVRRFSRMSIKLSLEEARTLNAVQLTETIDKDKIKVLYKSGHKINGVSEICYIQVRSSEREK